MKTLITPRSAASDLGLHCLPMSQKWEARLIWVNMTIMIFWISTDRSGQTMYDDIRLNEQSDQGLHCLPIRLHLLKHFCIRHCLNFRIIATIFRVS